MAVLVVEVSTERGIVALVNQGECLYFAALPLGLHNSKYLMPKVEEALSLCEIPLEALEAIAIGIGPGSFTGIRVGAMAAKTLSWSKKIPLVGICTLKAFLPSIDGPFISLIDAKMQGAFALNGEKKQGAIYWRGRPYLSKIENLKIEQGWQIVTPCKLRLQKELQVLFPGRKWDLLESAPDPVYLAQLAYEKLEKKEFSLDGALELIYLKGI